jgi:hypothetical protein
MGSRAARSTRRRGRPWLFFALLATVLVLVVNAAMSARSPGPVRQQAEQSYLDQALPAIAQSTQQGLDLGDVRARALTLSPATIVSHINSVVSETRQTLATVEKLNPPAAAKNAHALLVAALDMRYAGTEALSQAMTTVLSPQPLNAGVAALATAGTDFQAADWAYTLFQQDMPKVSPPLPGSQWVTDPGAYSVATLSVFVATLRSIGSLTPVHDVSVILVTTTPLPINLVNGVQILPVAKNLNLQVVVADVGNQAETNVMVTASIAPSAIGPTQSVRNFVDLAPGQSKTVNLGGLRVLTGQATTLTTQINPPPAQVDMADTGKVITLEMQ